MDIKKSIEWQETFKKTYKNSPNNIAQDACEACDMAIRALKLMGTDRKQVIVNKNDLDYDHRGDFVKCTDCERLSLIKFGGTTCNHCKHNTLMWVDPNLPEWSLKELEIAGFQIVDQ